MTLAALYSVRIKYLSALKSYPDPIFPSHLERYLMSIKDFKYILEYGVGYLLLQLSNCSHLKSCDDVDI